MERGIKVACVAGLLAMAGSALIFSLMSTKRALPTTGGTSAGTAADPNPVASNSSDTTSPGQRTELSVDDPSLHGLDHPFAYELACTVLDEYGLPVPGASVELAPAGGELNAAPGTTDRHGSLTVKWRGKRPHMELDVALGGGKAARRLEVTAGHAQPVFLGDPIVNCRACHMVPKKRAAGIVRLTLAFAEQDGTYALVVSGCAGMSGRSSLSLEEGLHPHARFMERWTPRQQGPKLRLTGGILETNLAQLSAGSRGRIQNIQLDITPTIITEATTATTPETPASPAVLTGTVYGTDGRPVRDTVVVWGQEVDRPSARAVTGDDGTFRAEVNEFGALELRAGGGDGGLRRARMPLTSGQTTRWDPVLEHGSLVRGRATGADGKPLVGWRVEIVGMHEPWFDACSVQEDGTFILPNQRGGVVRLLLWSKDSARKLPMLVVPAVLPDTGDVDLAITEATGTDGVLRVEPVPPRGVPDKSLKARAWQEESGRGAPMQRIKDAKGYELKGLPAGWYRVEVRAPGLGWHDTGRTWVDGKGLCDLGPVSLPEPGRLRVEMGTAVAETEGAPQLYRRGEDVDVHVADVGNSDKPVPLPAGEYWCLWKQVDGRVRQLSFQIRPGEETALELPLGGADESR